MIDSQKKHQRHNFEKDVNLPKGIHRIWNLPEKELGELWDSIIVDEKTKKQLLSQAVVNFTVRRKVSRNILPLHGVILLVGVPGTGKTSLARGLAHRVAESFAKNAGFRLLEIEPHSLTSSAMGKTQRAVSDLFSQGIGEAAANGPTIVLLDEVETLAVDRSKLSLDANPIDIHRATDAVLVQLDMLADQYPELLFVATSNFAGAIDEAFTSRCDLIIEIPLPNYEACKKILQSCLDGLGRTFSNIGKLHTSPKFEALVQECIGLDGRAIRKCVAAGIASSPQTALDPDKVTIDDLILAVKSAKLHSKNNIHGNNR